MSAIKPKLLLLVHRIPYPPNKGDKIRSFNLLKMLSKQYSVYLGCFIDDPFDKQYVDTLSQWCEGVCCLDKPKWQSNIRALSGFIKNAPITLPYFYDATLQSWVDKVITQHNIENVLVYSSSMAQYVDKSQYSHLHRVIDFVDIDSDKWRQYAAKARGFKKWFYQREARLLSSYEQAICQRFNASLFVSEDEASAFRNQLTTTLHGKVHSILNGVDTHYFSDTIVAELSSVSLPEHFIVFTGAMDYWANVDAVCWFCRHIWPALKQQHPDLYFVIVGGNPTTDVTALANIDGVIVTGRVADVRPYIAHAHYAVAPMLIARGIQNKVLEAMSMNKAVVCTAMAMEGINAPVSDAVRVSDSIKDLTQACLELLQTPPAQNSNRQFILQHFTWQQTLSALPALLVPERTS